MKVNKTHILIHVGLHRCTACIIILILNICPYNKIIIIDFHGGKYRVIWGQYNPVFTSMKVNNCIE